MKAYKGFHKNEKGELVCNGFVFKEGETYEHDGDVKLCSCGFHACEDALDCYSYYPPATSEYHEVEMEDVSDETGNDSKMVCRKITIGKKLSFSEISEIHFQYVCNRAKKIKSNTGNRSNASNTGDWEYSIGYGQRIEIFC